MNEIAFPKFPSQKIFPKVDPIIKKPHNHFHCRTPTPSPTPNHKIHQRTQILKNFQPRP
jgi:hypothetical protein